MQYAVAVFYECFPMRRLAEAAEEMSIAIEGPEFNSVRRHRASVSAHDCDWYFDLTGDALIGQGQFWTTPTCAALNPIDCPAGMTAPDHIMPVITNRTRA